MAMATITKAENGTVVVIRKKYNLHTISYSNFILSASTAMVNGIVTRHVIKSVVARVKMKIVEVNFCLKLENT
jgi:hypothetical protein